MTREEHLAFCKKCLNRKFDPNQGIICKITDKIADFEESCENFERDEEVPDAPVQTSPSEEPSAIELISNLSPEARAEAEKHQDIVYALVGGLFVAIIGALLWALITVSTEYQIGYMAIGIGLLVGFGVRYFGAGINIEYGIIGGALALFSCLLGNLFSQVGFFAHEQHLSYFQTISLLDFNTILLIFEETFSPMDLFFYGIATWEGYRFAFRPVPINAKPEELVPAQSKLRLPLVIVFFVIISGVAFALSKGVNGEQVFYYESGKLLSKGNFEDGKENGIWKYYYENGKIQIEGNYANGVESGAWKWYYESGEPMRVGNYKGGLSDGLWVNYYPSGIVSDSVLYVEGRQHGRAVSYFENGNKSQEGTVNRDHQEGLWKVYYENGKLSTEGNFKDGELSGVWKFWDESGNLLRELNYTSSDDFLFINMWDEKQKQIIKDGQGSFIHMHPNNMIAMKGSVVDGKKTGVWKTYFFDGTIQEEGTYENNEYLVTNAWNNKGEQTVKGGNGQYENYYEETGNIYEEGLIKDGRREGYWAVYYPESYLLQQELHYKDGKLNGHMKSYYNNGNVQAEGEMINDQKSGEWSWYFESAQLQCVANYVDNEKEGVQTFWSESGIKAKEEVYEHGKLTSERML